MNDVHCKVISGSPAGRRTRRTRWTPRSEMTMSRRLPTLRKRLRDAAADVMVDAAERTMLAKGFAGTTMHEIAAAAGCAVGTLYLHFKNKEELLGAIVRKRSGSLTDDMFAAFEGVTDPVEKLRIFITAHLRWAHEHPAVADLVGSALPQRYYDFKDSLRKMLPEEHTALERSELQFIREAQAAGRMRTDVSAQALADVVDGFLYTVMDQFCARPKTYTLDEQITMTWGFIAGGILGNDSAARPSKSRALKPSKKKHA
jgi:TetR/AcrR family transcriptional regulator, fatty acid metabolism regulator protein